MGFNEDNENQNVIEIDGEVKEKRHKRAQLAIIFAILLCLFLGGYVIYCNRYYKEYQVLATTEKKDASTMYYMPFHGKLLKYSKDGISYLNSKGEGIWTESFTMKQPKAVVCEDYVVVADLNGNSYYLFDEKGKVGKNTTPYPICNVKVASQGVVAVVLEESKENYIKLYNKSGKELVDVKTSMEQSGYPLDIAVSSDGTKLVVSYVALDGTSVKYSVGFYNFSKVGQNSVDRLVGGTEFGDTIVPKVEFVNNNVVCAYGDDKLVIYNMKQKPSERATIKVKAEINSVFSNEKYVGFVTNNTTDLEKGKYQLYVYNLSGRKVLEKTLNIDYNTIRVTKNEIILVGDMECYIYNFKGKERFHHKFGKNVQDMIPTENGREYMVVFEDATEYIRLK